MLPDGRPSIDATMMTTAWAWARRGTCSRLQVGAVVAQGDHPVAIGYNGAPRGLAHCVHDGTETRCTRAVHAETNAIIDAARRGTTTEGGTLYVTHMPCLACSGIIVNAGITRVVYSRPFRTTDGGVVLAEAGIIMDQFFQSWQRKPKDAEPGGVSRVSS